MGRFNDTVDRVFDRMKEAYLHNVAETEAENAPSEHELYEEYQEAAASEDPQAIANLIALRGQENFDKQAAKAINQVRQQMRERGVM